MPRFRYIFTNRNFCVLWLSQIVSNFGDRLNQMALIALVTKLSPHSSFSLALLFSFMVIPVFVIGPVAGTYIDRWDKRKIMIISDILRGLLVAAIPVMLIFFKSLIPVYVIVLIVFSLTRFFLPSKMAIIPELVSKDELLIANSLTSTTRMIATVLGLVCAGLLVKFIGVSAGFYIDALTYFISGALIALINTRGPSRIKEQITIAREAFGSALKGSVLSQIKEGINYLKGTPNMRFVMKVSLLLMGGVGAISVVSIVFVQEALGTVTIDLGFLGMMLAGGLFIGTLFYGRMGSKLSKEKVIFSSFIASGIMIIAFVFLIMNTHSWILGWILLALLGVVASPILISANTLIHEAMPAGLGGRIFSAVEIVWHLALIVAMLSASIMSEYVGNAAILVLCGAVFVVSGIHGVSKSNKNPVPL